MEKKLLLFPKQLKEISRFSASSLPPSPPATGSRLDFFFIIRHRRKQTKTVFYLLHRNWFAILVDISVEKERAKEADSDREAAIMQTTPGIKACDILH